MVANKRYQIFVSSTQADLRNEREAIISELTKVGYIAVGMEQFTATDEEQMDFIRQRNCSPYFGVMGAAN